AQGAHVYIVTGDKDMLQIVNDQIKVYDPMKEKVFDEAYVREKYGVGPGRIPEYMALTGDAIDNIPGIKGIGEKTARELLTEFRSLDDLLDNTGRIRKEKLRALVTENADAARLSKRLATLDTEVPLDFHFEEHSLKDPDWASFLPLCKEFEFGSLMKLAPAGVSASEDCETILLRTSLQEVVSMIKDEVSFDTETTGRNPVAANLVGLSISVEKDRSFYIPLAHAYTGAPEQLEKKEVMQALRAVFEDKDIAKIGHNLKYDITMLKKEGISVAGKLFDTMIASYLLNPNKQNHSLEEVALEHLSYRKKAFPEVLGKRTSFAEVPLEEAAPYACKDAALSLELKGDLFRELKEQDLERVYFDMEMPLIFVLAGMEATGVKIDPDRLREIAKELERELDSLTKRIYFLAGEEFNINSPKQLGTILFQNLGLRPGKKKKTGFSTDMSVLEELAEFHDLPREILNYRSMNKLKTTYIDVLPALINTETGRVHTSFNQAATATGRLSSSEPNLQNIPIKGEWGRRIREAFISESDHLLLSADYSQVELRILAHLSGDEGLINAFRDNLDVHSRTASEIFGMPLESVSSDARRIAKTVNFGVIYGISPFGLSEALSISREDARQYIDQYFARHPGVRTYIDKCIDDARCNGYVTTLFGRRRAIPEIRSKNSATRQQGERLAVNSPVQGTAADIIKLAMIRIWKKLAEKGAGSRMILQVHDELLFEVPPGELGDTTEIVRKEMEGVLNLSVPLRVEIHYGKNWAEAH
ncbi:MAG: DNA polymerase I, partial [Deltaproteobacteria bacterium]